ncbi:hypothetical protein J5Y03_08230 [Bacillus sp. RG28]|uniref:Uncharacterized protein n=1 Tax=Gottfriedia endophytica TaxID=2820819 RepID=A0A940SJR3_9BACI|nr:hypothetical protein [Gottfriedia endophytica]MBP0725179.1 hypothetical protein [Gottfriedia endophytica]
MKKFSLLISIVVVAVLSIGAILLYKSFHHTAETTTEPKSGKWGKVSLNSRMIGKVVILKDTPINKQNENGDLVKAGTAKKGQEYGAYSLREYGYESAYNNYISSTPNIKFIKAPEKQINPLRKTEPFIVNEILNTDDYELHSEQPEYYIIGLHNLNRKIWLGYQPTGNGQEIFFNGTIKNVEKNKITFTYAYTDDPSKNGTGTFTLNGKNINLLFKKNTDGKTENITFPIK